MAQVYKNPLEQANALVEKKRSTPEQIKAVTNSAIDEFGLTSDFNDAFYMLPDGRMLSGGGKQNRSSRVYDHRDINSPYYNNDLDFETERGGNSSNMMDFMRGGNIRLIPETSSIDLMANPTQAQRNAIYNLWKNGKINNIQISNPDDDYGQQLDYLEDIQKESQIANLFKKHYGN